MSRLNIRPGQFFKTVYRDFEGLASGKEVLDACKDKKGSTVGPTYQDGVVIDPTVKVVSPPGAYAWDIICDRDDSPELKRAVRSITLNLVFEAADTSEVPTFEEILATCYAVREVLTVPEWVEVTDQDIESIESAPDDEEDDNA